MALLLSGGVEIRVPLLASADTGGWRECPPGTTGVRGGRVVTLLPLGSGESLGSALDLC